MRAFASRTTNHAALASGKRTLCWKRPSLASRMLRFIPRVGLALQAWRGKIHSQRNLFTAKFPAKCHALYCMTSFYVLENLQETYKNHHITGGLKLFVETWDGINFSIKISSELRLSCCGNEGHRWKKKKCVWKHSVNSNVLSTCCGCSFILVIIHNQAL